MDWVAFNTNVVAIVTKLLASNELLPSVSTLVGNWFNTVVDCGTVDVTADDMLLVVSGLRVVVLVCIIADDKVVRIAVASVVVLVVLLMLRLLNGG